MLDEPTGRRNHEIDAAPIVAAVAYDCRVEALALRRDARATHDGLGREGSFGQTGGELFSLAEDLGAELTGATQDERTYRIDSAGKRCRVTAQQTLDSWHEKREGLACAGLRLGEHVRAS